jgi:hypothetical protein
MSKPATQFRANCEASGWKVKTRQRERFGKIHWKAEAIRGGKRFTVTAATEEEALRQLWEMAATT